MSRNRPQHVGFIPDGNRRWAQERGMPKQEGYPFGVEPGLALFEMCRRQGIDEISIYGFTQDNTRRPSEQKDGFSAACVDFGLEVARRGAALLVVGDESAAPFPPALREFRTRQGTGTRVNLLVNYGWEWDLRGLRDTGRLRSDPVPRLDLIVRWGGGRRLSGFLPVQSVYADFYVVEDYWPDFRPEHFRQALDWFRNQDRTLGG
ncbi:undecaprenyl diphosphate synthase family protein [Thiohalorhabdus sp. Cl-TMA]|uniref:Undecaprenyl diphosphate synthase family protein n=1 Tax=Thiohalorhabdus methylotrophus TaxID=3242694 RepID=A0ABV4TZ25_9GAMM